MSNSKFSILSTFTGGGGLDIGFHGDFTLFNNRFKALPFDTIIASDRNPYACETIKNNPKYFSKTETICADITKYDFKTIEGSFDVLLGGFPCVTFSVVGKQQGITDDLNGKLYESFATYVEYFKPKVFLAENVKGILSANKGEAVKIIKQRFEIDGYDLKVFLVNFADFGVPQLRQRVLFIGIRKDIKTPFIPPEYTRFNNHLTVEEAFADLPQSCPNHQFLRSSKRTEQMLSLIPAGGNFKALIGTEYEVKALMSNIYRRLKGSEPAYTVIASGGGGTWTYHHEDARALTNRERARLQAFPDDFVFQGSSTEIRRQIGNAVPPVGIHPFAERIACVLQGIIPSYDPTNCIQEIYIDSPVDPNKTPKQLLLL
ncbi:MAG: DNA cytosine methyltransferase [Vampirovibrionales bacterium]